MDLAFPFVVKGYPVRQQKFRSWAWGTSIRRSGNDKPGPKGKSDLKIWTNKLLWIQSLVKASKTCFYDSVLKQWPPPSPSVHLGQKMSHLDLGLWSPSPLKSLNRPFPKIFQQSIGVIASRNDQTWPPPSFLDVYFLVKIKVFGKFHINFWTPLFSTKPFLPPSHSVFRCARTSLLAKKISILGGGTKLERNQMTMKTKRWMNDEQIWTVLVNGIKIQFLWQQWT